MRPPPLRRGAGSPNDHVDEVWEEVVYKYAAVQTKKTNVQQIKTSESHHGAYRQDLTRHQEILRGLEGAAELHG